MPLPLWGRANGEISHTALLDCAVHLILVSNMADMQLTARWTVSETVALIDVCGCDSIPPKIDGTVQDTDIYKQVQTRLSDAGYFRNIIEIKTKVKALRRTYQFQRDKG
ncbi:hypothetical protein X975_08155, partial [Stegodyphus mimosarum]